MMYYIKIFENWSQICAIFIASMTILNEGLLLSWPSPAIIILTNPEHPFKITQEEASYFTVLSSASFFISALPMIWIINKIGRKNTLILATIPYLISGILIGISRSKWIYYAARLIQGFGTSASFCATPLYCGEVALPKVRGKWGNLMVIESFLGILIISVVGSYLGLIGMAYVCIGTPIINLILLICIPESPYYLTMIGRQNDARTSLQWFRQRKDVDEELTSIANAVQRQMQTTSSFKDIVQIKSNRKALTAMLVVRLAQQLCGISAINVYSHTLFEMAGGNFSASTSVIICGVVQLVFAGVGALVVHKFGRRYTLFSSAICTNMLLLLLATYFFIDTETNLDVTSLSWFPLVGVVAYLVAYSLGLSTVPTLLAAELFSSSVKEKSISIHNMLFAFLIGTTSKLFQVLAQYGLYVPLTFFAVMCSTLTAVAYFVVPETKGKTLDEIQLAFNGKKNTDNQHV